MVWLPRTHPAGAMSYGRQRPAMRTGCRRKRFAPRVYRDFCLRAPSCGVRSRIAVFQLRRLALSEYLLWSALASASPTFFFLASFSTERSTLGGSCLWLCRRERAISSRWACGNAVPSLMVFEMVENAAARRGGAADGTRSGRLRAGKFPVPRRGV